METLRDILDAAARGVFPPADGGTTVVPQACRRDVGVLSFTAHSVVFTDEDPDWVHATLRGLDCDALAATMNPRFLTALLDRTGRVAAVFPSSVEPSDPALIKRIDALLAEPSTRSSR